MQTSVLQKTSHGVLVRAVHWSTNHVYDCRYNSPHNIKLTETKLVRHIKQS